VLAFGIIENGRSWLFSTKMGVVWPLIIDQTLIRNTMHCIALTLRDISEEAWLSGIWLWQRH
jgi:hypothetical protein